MITNVHEGKISKVISFSSQGDNVLIPKVADAWIYIHELSLTAGADNAVTALASDGVTDREFGTWNLLDGGDIILKDLSGDAGEPRFKCAPGEDFIINLDTAGAIEGSVVYSLRY